MDVVGQTNKYRFGRVVSRRQFVGGCAGCAAGLASLSEGILYAGALDVLKSPAAGGGTRPRIRLVLTYPDPRRPIWPNVGYDFSAHNRDFLSRLRQACPTVDFLTATVNSDEDAKRTAAADSEVDGYLVYFSGCHWAWRSGKASEILGAGGKPLIFVDHLHAGSGAFLTTQAAVRRSGSKVLAVSSSDIADVAEAVRCVACLKQLRQSRILVVGREPSWQIQDCFGAQMQKVEFSELGQSCDKVDSGEAHEQAERWVREAQELVEPSLQEVDRSAAMYLAMCDLMRRHEAQAIAVNCLSGFYSGQLAAYPCLGFMQLNNDGYVGACEADQNSALTMLLMAYLTGRPGFISDPVIDTARNQIIYDHCVAPTKVFGAKGPANPYQIRDHSEDRKGACNRSLMPLGEMTTTIEFNAGRKEVILHQGVTVENVDEDMACRNKLAVEVSGDVYKLLDQWDQWGWHRVTFYGDYRRAVYNVAQLLDFHLVEEA